MYVVYGIPNCDTIKKTLDWLNKHKIKYSFHDYKKEGVGMDKLKSWSKQVGWEKIFNKKSTVWKELGPEIQATVADEKTALPILKENTSIIKRPLIESDGKVVAVGFKDAEFQKIFLS